MNIQYISMYTYIYIYRFYNWSFFYIYIYIYIYILNEYIYLMILNESPSCMLLKLKQNDCCYYITLNFLFYGRLILEGVKTVLVTYNLIIYWCISNDSCYLVHPLFSHLLNIFSWFPSLEYNISSCWDSVGNLP
jgi:hypothetical protein